jgi:hypothetical protein
MFTFVPAAKRHSLSDLPAKMVYAFHSFPLLAHLTRTDEAIEWLMNCELRTIWKADTFSNCEDIHKV